MDLVSQPNLIFRIKRSKNLNLPFGLALNMLSVLFGCNVVDRWKLNLVPPSQTLVFNRISSSDLFGEIFEIKSFMNPYIKKTSSRKICTVFGGMLLECKNQV